MLTMLPYTGNTWQRNILANYTGKSYWRGKFWQISYSQCICQIHFQCICALLVRKLLANSSQFAKFANFFPLKFSHIRYCLTY